MGLFVLPSFPSLVDAIEAFQGTGVEVGAQDLFWEDRGAYTGEVSGLDLSLIGCTYVAIGHAERRSVLGEDDRMTGAKLSAALRNGLTPVICIGEKEQTDAARAVRECIDELEALLVNSEVTHGAPVILAYEPRWAIGAAKAASPEHVAEVADRLRTWLDDHPLFSQARVIYGGSAGPGTLTELGSSVDGLFLGRFAHDPDALRGILDESLARKGTEPSMEGGTK
ncbi:MAG: triosephosphate isomerase [Microbacteriaceae bacterium]|nr:triosephosphate isomerase [Microbacteriaceae bacterium]